MLDLPAPPSRSCGLPPPKSRCARFTRSWPARLQQSGVRLEFEPGDNPFISIDLSLIKQVLINLVRNAAEATPKAAR